MSELAKVLDELTPSQKTRLIRHAVSTARKAGYCDEVVHILNLMGFRVPGFSTDIEVNQFKHHDDQPSADS